MGKLPCDRLQFFTFKAEVSGMLFLKLHDLGHVLQ